MLKAMRKHAKFFYILFFIVILSFIFWGVGSVDKSTTVPVAEVEKEKISIEEYWMAYDRAREFYRNIMKERFNEEVEKQMNLKQQVMDSLIDERVLLVAAKKTGITVSDKELEDAIVNDPAFMRNNRFDKDIYLRVLQLNRMTPQFFESMKRKELALNKMRRLIAESVDITDIDIAGATTDQAKQAALFSMREAAVKSYVEGLKKEIKIKVNKQLIS